MRTRLHWEIKRNETLKNKENNGKYCQEIENINFMPPQLNESLYM